jgi:hypothetical protein
MVTLKSAPARLEWHSVRSFRIKVLADDNGGGRGTGNRGSEPAKLISPGAVPGLFGTGPASVDPAQDPAGPGG